MLAVHLVPNISAPTGLVIPNRPSHASVGISLASWWDVATSVVAALFQELQHHKLPASLCCGRHRIVEVAMRIGDSCVALEVTLV